MRILMATDGGAHSQVALAGLLNLPLRDEAHVLVVTVVPPSRLVSVPEPLLDGAALAVPTDDLVQTAQKEAEHILAETTAPLRPTGAKIETAVLLGSPAAQIVQAAQEWGADMIVLGCRQRRGWRMWLQGSVARDVVRGAPCPVFVVPVACAERQHARMAALPGQHTPPGEFTEDEMALAS